MFKKYKRERTTRKIINRMFWIIAIGLIIYFCHDLTITCNTGGSLSLGFWLRMIITFIATFVFAVSTVWIYPVEFCTDTEDHRLVLFTRKKRTPIYYDKNEEKEAPIFLKKNTPVVVLEGDKKTLRVLLEDGTECYTHRYYFDSDFL